MKKKRYKKVLLYIFVPIIYTITGLVLIFFAGEPFFHYIDAKINMVVINGEPNSALEYTKETLDSNTIQFEIPVYGSQYGLIYCNVIGLEAPIYYGDDNDLLQKGVGQYIGSAMPGQGGTVLIGGHDVTFFATLEKISVEDEIEIKTNYGTFKYQVEKCEIVDATDSNGYNLEQSTEKLILYTCYPFGEIDKPNRQRYFVYCKKI